MTHSTPSLLLTLLLLTPTLAKRKNKSPPAPNVPWASEATFVLDKTLSDEFSGKTLDESKWDTHGLRNPDTGCPKWNGPPSTAAPEYHTFYPTPTDPVTGEPKHAQFRLKRGHLQLKIAEKPLSFFTDREYYCNTTTFHCNHTPSIPCFATDFNGDPVYADAAKTRYRGVLHDKCKREPFCIPHPVYVTRKPRVYTKYVANHLVSKATFKYGYVETKVRLPRSPALTAVWMHNDEMVNGYCRWRRSTDPAKPRNVLECPSAIRSRRWQEIDMLEAMNTDFHRRRYIPNIHAFAGYKGEFTSAVAVDNGDGTMGGGPIVVRENVFNQKPPSFADLNDSVKVGNDFHLSPGSVHTLDTDWADKSRIIGMYWSPNEVRFLVDGVEVRRYKNTLIHQPMFLDISNGWNVPWGKDIPKKRDLRKKSKIDYIRRWEVFTEGGVEPTSALPLNLRMEAGFKNLYGTELNGVLGRFPVNDDLTIVQTLPEKEDVILPTPPPLEEDSGEPDTSPEASVRQGLFGLKEVFNMTGDYLEDELDALTLRIMKGNKKLGRAGGAGNRRFSRQRRRMTARERRIALGRPDRIAVVPKPGAMPRPVEDAAITVFEFTDPNKDAAGWSTENGAGTQLSLA